MYQEQSADALGLTGRNSNGKAIRKNAEEQIEEEWVWFEPRRYEDGSKITASILDELRERFRCEDMKTGPRAAPYENSNRKREG